MAAGTTEIADIIVPDIFTPYSQTITEEKSRMLQSGAVVRDAALDGHLAGGGLLFDAPSFKDLDNDDDNVSSDTGSDSGVKKIGTLDEVSVRLSRNQSWAGADLAADLAGADPMTAIGNRVGSYWARRAQIAFVATMMGLFADNDAAPDDAEHTQYDLTLDVSGAGYAAGVTDFSAEAFIDAAATMGDSMESLGLMLAHSIVYARMQKNNLIDFIPDADGRVVIPTFLGRLVIVDDGCPNPAGAGAGQTASGVYHSWLFGAGAVRWGVGQAKVPTETKREPLANNGGGEEILTNRVVWALHPVGHAYVGTTSKGGPTNASTEHNLAHTASWQRVFSERKQVKVARLITRES